MPLERLQKVCEPHMQMCEDIKGDIASGGRAYFIFPRIESRATANLKTVKSEHPLYVESQVLGEDVVIEMIHGQLSASEQNERARRFKAGETHVLFATSLVEVGFSQGIYEKWPVPCFLFAKAHLTLLQNRHICDMMRYSLNLWLVSPITCQIVWTHNLQMPDCSPLIKLDALYCCCLNTRNDPRQTN